MAFQTLFPDCVGDPTNNYKIRSRSGNEIEKFASKLKYLIKYAEKIDGGGITSFQYIQYVDPGLTIYCIEEGFYQKKNFI